MVHIDEHGDFPALDVLEYDRLPGGRICHLDDRERILILAGMLSGLCFGMKDQLMVIWTQGYLYVLVQLDFEFLRVYVVEFHQGPVVGLIVTIREHTLVFHLHLHGVKLHPVAAANIYCYIFGMMNLFKLFLKPIDVSALDDMRLHDIMKLTGRLQDGNNIIVLAKDKGHRVSQLQHIIADRIKLLIGWSGQADVSALTIEFHDDTIIVFDEKFNKLAHEYAAEHKLYCDATSWTTWRGFYNAIDESVQYSYNFTPESQKGTLVDMAKVITDGMVKAHRSFDSLRQVARKFDWAVPVVEYIRVYPSGDDD